jgi:hypothetical protein
LGKVLRELEDLRPPYPHRKKQLQHPAEFITADPDVCFVKVFIVKEKSPVWQAPALPE